MKLKMPGSCLFEPNTYANKKAFYVGQIEGSFARKVVCIYKAFVSG